MQPLLHARIAVAPLVSRPQPTPRVGGIVREMPWFSRRDRVAADRARSLPGLDARPQTLPERPVGVAVTRRGHSRDHLQPRRRVKLGERIIDLLTLLELRPVQIHPQTHRRHAPRANLLCKQTLQLVPRQQLRARR